MSEHQMTLSWKENEKKISENGPQCGGGLTSPRLL